MCFSSTASFVAAGTLSALGAVSLNTVRKPSQLMLAAVPLLFGLQQFSEGFLWLALQNSSYSNWRNEFTWTFLFFAQFLWTTWIPLSFRMIETNRVRRLMLNVICFFGILASLLLGFRLLFYPVTVEISAHHIYYGIDSPHWMNILSSVCYVMAIIFPPFVSSLHGIKWLGVLLLTSLVVTKIFYTEHLISVWCFFAAIISAGIIVVLHVYNRDHHFLHSARRLMAGASASAIEPETRGQA